MAPTAISQRRLATRFVALAASGVVAVSLCHVVVEKCDWRFRQPTADASLQTIASFVRSNRKVDVAFVGSSRMRRAVTVPVIESTLRDSLGRSVTAFNLGLQGAVAPSLLMVVRDVLREERLPSVIVLGLGARGLNDNSSRYARAISHLFAPGDLLGPFGPRSADEWVASARLLFRAPTTLLQVWRSPTEEVASLVARGGSFHAPMQDVPESISTSMDLRAAENLFGRETLGELVREIRDKSRERGALARRSLLAHFEMGRAKVALEQVLQLCRERGVSLVVLNLPVTRSFREAAYMHGEYGEYVAYVRAKCRAADVDFVDLAEPPWLPHDAFFEDGDHLNRVGAHLLSARLAREVIAPLLDLEGQVVGHEN